MPFWFECSFGTWFRVRLGFYWLFVFRGEDNKAMKSHSLIEKFNGLDVMVMN